jgi:hypothetical protein
MCVRRMLCRRASRVGQWQSYDLPHPPQSWSLLPVLAYLVLHLYSISVSHTVGLGTQD